MRSLKQTTDITPPAGPKACHTEEVAEIVTFRLNAGASRPEFHQAAQAITPALERTGAAKLRTLSVDADGLWTDHIIWTSMTGAKDAAALVMQDPAAAPFVAMIDPQSVQLRHAVIGFSQNMESNAPD